MNPPRSGPTAAAIAAEAPTSAYARVWPAPWKFPWMSDCIAGRSRDAPSPPMIAQNTMMREDRLREGHRDRAGRVGEESDDVGAFAADQVADLAPDQDERRRHQRFERDRGLDAAHRRVEVVHDRRDRDVHDRRVDDEHEHRHREEQREPPVEGRGLVRGVGLLPGHALTIGAARGTGVIRSG